LPDKYLRIMSVHINFNLDHPYFREPLRVRVEWKFPFLPRVGELVNAWIWIEEAEISNEKIESLLTAEGEDSRNAEIHKTFSLNAWLYEVGMECNKVYSISYYKEDSAPHDIYVEMYLNDTGIYHR
jgi:hypothetical protein